MSMVEAGLKTIFFFSDSNLFYYLMELNSLALEYFLGYYATMDVWVGDHILQMT